MLLPARFNAIFLTWLFCLSTIYATVHVHDETFIPDVILRVTAGNTSLDCQSRYSTIINGSVPGPEVRIPAGQVTWIRVYNDIDNDNLTVHWHGLTEAVAPFSDGTPLVSQWPIPPHHFFDYEVAPSADLAGTYFYHSHVGMQALSAFGALIVEDAGPPPYAYDEDRVILFSDYFNKTDAQMISGLVANPFQWTGEVNKVLVNGFAHPNQTDDDTSSVSKRSESEILDRRNAPSDNGKCGLYHFGLSPDKTYRLRFIGATGLSLLSVALQNHTCLTIIEADGRYTQPYETSFLQVASGQRYSVLLKAKSRAELAADRAHGTSSYFMQLETRVRPQTDISYAVIDYPGLTDTQTLPPAKQPAPPPPYRSDWLDNNLTSRINDTMPPSSAVSRTVHLSVVQVNLSSATPQLVWQTGNSSWTTGVVQQPYLISVYDNATAALPQYDYAVARGGYDDRAHAWPAHLGEVVDLILQLPSALPAKNGTLDSHPFHMHGRHYWDLGSGPGQYDAAAHAQQLSQRATPPPVRDTSVLSPPANPGGNPAGSAHAGGWRALRVAFTQPGAWMFHCHTLAHMMMGMQTIWVIGDEAEVLRLGYPEVQGYLTYGGDAVGNSTHYPRVNHYFS